MEKVRRSIVYAFLPLGSASTAKTHYIRLGHACKHSDGTLARLATRFHGLNRVRELLLVVEVNSCDVHLAMDTIGLTLSGPGSANGIRIENHTTFETAYRLGQSWRETTLPLADVRAVFYHISDCMTTSHMTRPPRGNHARAPGFLEARISTAGIVQSELRT